MPQVSLSVEKRTQLGSNAVKWLRRAGKLPAIIYGKDLPESLPITIDAHEFDRFVATNPLSTLVELDLESPKIVMVKEIQRHKVTRTPLHVDFLLVDLDRELEFKVRVALVGNSKGVKAGGVLEQISHTIDISCLPSAVPASIEVDIANLDVGELIAVKDLVIAEGLKLLADPLTVICSVKTMVEKAPSDEDPSEPERIGEKNPQ